MIRHVASLIKRLVGRFKENMVAVNLTVVAIAIPLGFYLLVEMPEESWFGRTLVVIGVFALVIVNIFVDRERKRANLEKLYFAQQLEDTRTDIVHAIKELVNEIREERNERKRNE